LPFTVAGAFVLAVVLFVNHETNDVPAVASYNSQSAVAEQHREDAILVRQQQAPHVARAASGEAPAVAARRAVVAYMNRQINSGSMAGPIRHASCRAAAGSTRGRLVFHCFVTASALVVTYPFDDVVQPRAGTVTYCQRVAPPIPSMNIPVSRRCT
jgi:hypothetical protein